MDWTVMDWTVVDWTVVDWTVVDWTVVDWTGMNWTGEETRHGRGVGECSGEFSRTCEANAYGRARLKLKL